MGRLSHGWIGEGAVEHRPHRRSGAAAGCAAAVFVVAFLVRVVPFGLYVTPDEPIWVLRSLQALEAVESGDWEAIPQTGHPGLTTMALGALGIRLTEWISPEATAHRDWVSRIASLAPENGAAFPHLAAFLPAGRLMVALVTAASLALAYLIGRHRLGDRAARLAALLLAMDPFVAGHSGLLHTDGLQATFVLLAVLCVFPEGYRLPHRGRPTDVSRDQRPFGDAFGIVIAAFFLALAGLTKMLGLLAAPGLALAVLLWTKGSASRRAGRVAALALLTLVFLIALYPPAWTDLRSAPESLVSAVTYHESIGLRPVFFAGETTIDPGPWFYPAVLLFRLTPPVLVGLLILAWSRRDRRAGGSGRLVWILLPALSYLVGISVAGKKFDRYVLTVIPLVTLLAAYAWQRAGRRWRFGVLASLTLPWALVSLLPLQYATPLLGGPRVAQGVVPLGWGEASGLAARWLNRRVEPAESATVMTDNVPGTAGLFSGVTWSWDEARVGCTDYAIDQAGPLPATYALLDVVRAAGREQVRIYGHVQAAIASHPLVVPGPLHGVGDDAVAPVTGTDGLQAWLAQRFPVGDTFIWVQAPECYPLTDAQLTRVIDDGVTNGALACVSGAPLAGLASERCTVLAVQPEVAAFSARFGNGLDLVAATWESMVQAPDPLTVHLRWQAQVPLEEVEVYLALRDVGGIREVIWAEGGRRLLSDWGWAAPSWPVGDLVDTEAYVPLPLTLPPGTYGLVLRVSGPRGASGITTPSGVFGGTDLYLGTVRITQASRAAGESVLSNQVKAVWPGLRVAGAELPASTLLAGRRMPLSLVLERAAGTPPAALHWDLVCGGESRDGGDLSLLAYGLAAWNPGYPYVLRFAPRVDPDTPEGPCVVSVWPVAEGSDTASAMDGHIVVGDVAIAQRPRNFVAPDDLDVVSTVAADQFARLLGVNFATTNLDSGGSLTVTLYWHVQGDAARDYTVFVHAVGPDGRVWGQSDAWPAQGTAPSMTWVSGEIIADEHQFSLRDDAPHGTYELVVGLYDASDGSRVPLTVDGERTPDDRAPVATFVVGSLP